MRRARRIGALVVGALLLAYVTTFSIWWFGSPSQTIMVGGRRVHLVQFRYTKLYYRTRVIWIPAHFVVEHIFGYEPISLMAAESESVLEYAK